MKTLRFNNERALRCAFSDGRLDPGRVCRFPEVGGVWLATVYGHELYQVREPYGPPPVTPYTKLRTLRRAKWMLWAQIKHHYSECTLPRPPL